MVRDLQQGGDLLGADDDISFEIVPHAQDAAQLIMEWRNDSETRAQSFHEEPKTWPGFFSEFLACYVSDPTLPCFFALQRGERVAFVRFRRITSLDTSGVACVEPQALSSAGRIRINDGAIADYSIVVAPHQRGRGLGVRVTRAIMPIMRGLGLVALLAEVKDGNQRSKSMFVRAGFKLLDKRSGLVPDTGNRCVVERFTLDLTEKVCLNGCRVIGDGNPCFVIAEAGSNWRLGSEARDLKMAKALIDVAKEAGADAVKFQTYRPETTYVANAGESDYLSESGISESISEIFSDLAMPYDMLKELALYCKSVDIMFMSSPFSVADFRAVDPWVALHKIASYEISHIRLLEAAANAGKPVVLSTGASDYSEIEWAVSHFRSLSKASLCLMQCTAKYPAPLSTLNVRAIPHMKARFGVPVGLSDHSREPIAGPVAAVALGANLIEKHYTIANRLPGPDHKFAVDPAELKSMVAAIRQVELALGHGVKVVQDEERELFYYAKRGLQAIKDIEIGDNFVEDVNFAILRPGKRGIGMSPRFIGDLHTATAKKKISAGEGIREDDFGEVQSPDDQT